MKELIKIERNRIGEDEVNSVDARELHGFLESKQEFSNWIKNRIHDYGFNKGQDFLIILSKTPTGGRPRENYIISIDMAKELSMVERNAKGKEARQYFIQRDKQLSKIQSGKIAIPDFTNPAEAAMAWAAEYEARQIAEQTKAHINNKKTATAMVTASHLSRENNTLRPKAEAWDQFFEANNVYRLTLAFRILELNTYVHFRRLKEMGYLVKCSGTHIPSEWCVKEDLLKVRFYNQREGKAQAHIYVTHKGLGWLRELFCIEEELTG